ncbi:hypothetical protein C943_02413 [Mariniradius saccharolyticus AK6]|uniref:Uncharacterized protein n=1 Tax=Mariniradius saccharolyticus AK6 TaxID=1239962 RepID=M7Y227_9BACT|nr:hypothetical protein C943_02413 [Mariniradius saccharolyticus AK6]
MKIKSGSNLRIQSSVEAHCLIFLYVEKSDRMKNPFFISQAFYTKNFGKITSFR